MTPERLDSLTHRRTMVVRARGETLTQLIPGLTQQMFYRLRLTPDAADLRLSVFCSGAKLSQFENALTSLFGYRLVGRSQGEGLGLVFAPDPTAVAAVERQRLQGPAAMEAGIAQALIWMKVPSGLSAIARTRCPAAGSLQDEDVQRAFRLHADLPRRQRTLMMAGHPVTLPLAALPPSSRALLPAGKAAPKWVTYYLHQNPWRSDSQPRLAVRAEPSGVTWISCPPLDLAPAQFPTGSESDPVFRTRLKGEPDLEDLDPGEEAGAVLEWLAEQGKIWIMAEALRPHSGGPEQLKNLAPSFNGLSLEEGLDRAAATFGATWRFENGWVLLQRRSTEKT